MSHIDAYTIKRSSIDFSHGHIQICFQFLPFSKPCMFNFHFILEKQASFLLFNPIICVLQFKLDLSDSQCG